LAERAPVHPYLVLALAIVLPGSGHVALGLPFRGLGFAFFTLLLALMTWHVTTPAQSFIGRAAAGLFVWALSIPDAYRIARLRYEIWRRRSASADPVA
jgi:hypothetical protein